jgi:hypothetical protein
MWVQNSIAEEEVKGGREIYDIVRAGKIRVWKQVDDEGVERGRGEKKEIRGGRRDEVWFLSIITRNKEI